MYARTIILGRLGADPERKSDSAPVRFPVAVSRRYRAKDGENKEDTQWYRVTVFGPQSGPCLEFLGKGDLVLCDGTMRFSTYEKDGQKHNSAELMARQVTFMPRGTSSPQEAPSQRQDSESQRQVSMPDAPDPGDDDIPF